MNFVRNSLLMALTLVMTLGLILMPATPTVAQSPAQTDAMVRIIHASPDAPEVDVYVNGGDTPLATELSFFESTGYVNVAPLTITSVEFRAAGDPATGAPLVTITPTEAIEVMADMAYTVAAVGLVGGSGDQAFDVQVFADDLSAPAAGQSNVRVYHLSPNAPAVNVQAVNDGTADLATGLEYRETVSSPVAVAAGTYTINVLAPSVDPLSPVLSVENVRLQSGKIYDFFAVGLVSGDPALRVESEVNEANARVRVAHASPNTPNVDIYLDNATEPALTNVPFFTLTDYLDLPAGTDSVQVRVAGSEPNSTPALSETVSLMPGAAYTVGAIGLLADSTNPLALAAYADDLSAPAAGQAKVRVFHWNPGVPPVGVRVADGSELIPSLSFGSASDYLAVDAGSYNLEIFAVAAPGTPAVTLQNIDFKAGLIYDVFATGTGLADLVLQSQITAGNAQLRVAHASPDAPAVDVYLDGGETPVAANVPYYTLSDYLAIPAGSRSVQIRAAGTAATEDPLLQTSFIAAADKSYTLIARGLLDGEPAIGLSLYADDLSAPMTGQSNVRVFHLSPDAPAVDVRLPDGSVLIDGLAFTESTAISVPAGVYNLVVTTDDGATEVTTVSGIEFRPGQITEVFAIGLATPGSTPAFALAPNVLDTAARVKFVHAALNVGAVDVYVNGAPLVLGADFFSRSGFLWLPPGIGFVQVFAAGADTSSTAPLLSAGFTLLPGAAYTIAAQGDLNAAALAQNAPALAIYDATLDSPAPGQATVTVSHLSPDAPLVDVRVQNGPTLVDDLAFGQSFTFPVDAGTYTLEITTADGNTVVTTLTDVVLSAGLLYNIYATGTLAELTIQSSVQFPEDIPLTRVRMPFVAANAPQF
jgi:hypothetical protein